MYRIWLLAIVLGMAGFVLAERSAVAAEAPKHAAAHESEHGAKEHGAKNEGLFGQALDLAIWTVVVFLLLFFVLTKYAWGPMLEGLRKREQSIRGAIEDAQKAKDEAQRLREQYQQEVDKAHETVRGILDEARRDAQHTTDEMVAKARTEIAAERDRLRREIETAQDQALQQIWQQTAQLATMVSAKAIRRQLTADDHRRLVDEALAELNQRGDEWRKQLASTMG